MSLAGNPSDGFGGRTVSLAISNYSARVTVRESNALEIQPVAADRTRFDDVDDLVRDVRVNGYYGGVRLLKAAVRRLAAAAGERGVALGERSFAIEYETDVPRGVGLGGSSAIVTAALTALAGFCELEVESSELPGLALAVETDELGIAAGLQDRVAQVEGGLTFMDFDPGVVAANGRGDYERLDPELLPSLFVAHLERAAEPSEVFHSRLRHRFEAGEPAVVDAMRRLGAIAADARGAVLARDPSALGEAMRRNLRGPPLDRRARPAARAHGRAGALARRVGELRRVRGRDRRDLLRRRARRRAQARIRGRGLRRGACRAAAARRSLPG